MHSVSPKLPNDNASEVRRQAGFASMLLLLLFVVVVLGASYVGYRAMSDRVKTASTVASSPSTMPPVPVKYVGQSAANGQPLVTSTSSGSSNSSSGAASSGSSSNSSSSSSNTAASSSTNSGSASGDVQATPIIATGINGHVYLIGGCAPPLMCAEYIKPFQATVMVDSTAGTPITSFTSDSQGSFSVLLAPGKYLLVPASYNNGRTTAPAQTVSVVANHMTQVTIDYKSVR